MLGLSRLAARTLVPAGLSIKLDVEVNKRLFSRTSIRRFDN
jgi:hypothetical protein